MAVIATSYIFTEQNTVDSYYNDLLVITSKYLKKHNLFKLYQVTLTKKENKIKQKKWRNQEPLFSSVTFWNNLFAPGNEAKNENFYLCCWTLSPRQSHQR